MIQVRSNIFETNSSSTHCLTIMDRPMYDQWRKGEIAVSIQYIYDDEEKDKNFGVTPDIRLPKNFNTKKQAENIAKNKDGKKETYYRYSGLSNGDNGFMCTCGNFDTEAPIVRSIVVLNQKEENIKLLTNYIRDNKWYIDYLKESNEYEKFMNLINEYKETGKITKDMCKMFPSYLYYTADEYVEALKHDDCYSPFIHVFEKYVAFGYYFHS